MVDLPEHSPLGGSGMSRWMKCPGSVGLSEGIKDSASEYAALGTAAHYYADLCLTDGLDAWQFIGRFAPDVNNGEPMDKDMADAVQAYLDAIRIAHPDRDDGNFFIERGFHCPDIHKYFYGRLDCTYIDAAHKTLHVWDYKHGAGIVVDVKENPQCMYYGVGALTEFDLWEKVDTVVLHIVQPRGFHFDGPVRSWSISTDDLALWVSNVLMPAMTLATVSRDTMSGEHCRFCPARTMACPQIVEDFDELEKLMATAVEKGGAKELTSVQLGRFLNLFDTAKIIQKAANETVFNRLSAGKEVPGRKLAHARTNREWKEGAQAQLRNKFGHKAFTEPKLKTPAGIEKLPEGKAWSSRWAFKPDGGLCVVAAGDARAAVNKDTKALFKPVKKGKK